MRLYSVLETQLAGKDYIVGEYTIADIATFPWVVAHEWAGIQIDHLPNVKRWLETMAARPAVAKGRNIPERIVPTAQSLETAQKMLV